MIDLSFLAGQRIAVMGLARSGLAAAIALSRGGAEVLAWDDAEAGRTAATAAGLPLTDLHHADLTGVTALVLSPGIPHTFPAPHPVAARVRAAGIPVIGDVELLRRARPEATYLGITGTNGKSTTTALTGHILAAAGRRLQVGGNLGTPVLTFEPLDAGDVYVLEMSSYQLELTPSLGFDAAALLNITPDHLDRHGGMDGYVAAKRLAFRPAPSPRPALPVAVIGVDDAHCSAMADALEAEGGRRVVRISAERAVAGGVSAPDGVLVDDSEGRAVAVLDLRGCPSLPGRHNWQNACAAYALARAAGVAPEAIASAIRSFAGLAHRQQAVATIDGVRFVNDSKATNADAAAKALGCYDAIHWILGGKPKEGGLEGLDAFMPRVRHAFLIGAATEEFASWLAARGVPHTRCGTMETAVPTAFRSALAGGEPGAVVLLSPACASFDQYPNFEVRGDHFAKLVQALTEAGR
ncbi:UDP-N-acetylmuramoyl-L-alanine--D-glutamate ligase [Rhodospirillum centenum]|uniref:UDP-N-acetylmuramoylalanine--D-glutamate ligase n=1 Tax=Rhodospirillum centenum (strain ATCC 51521 / SW) TaxID=414684 RepID=B6IRG4_RHOCS|nr:UDP-N-acetylmuramoyl-L-alanine--D-glutamate ligase [Rhodospirillum centenum]ACI98050.1 UDP-N-acetylmuramoylalanine--D-glutamate ligase [Rhodospirillum centenum SW]